MDLLENLALNIFEKSKNSVDPLIICVTGNISSGKSTLAKKMAVIYQQFFPALSVSAISTDDFLLSNKELKHKNIFNKKGFPISYNNKLIHQFISSISNKESFFLPLYDHELNDINSQKIMLLDKPDIIIIEGVIALQPEFRSISSCSIFLNIDLATNYSWFLNRCLNLKLPQFYGLSVNKFIKVAQRTWNNIDMKNYFENILPLKYKADVQIKLNNKHKITNITTFKHEDHVMM